MKALLTSFGFAFALALLFVAGPVYAQPLSSAEDASADVDSQAAAPPAGQVARYVIPNYTSQATAPTRSVTVVTVHNNQPGAVATSCNVGVQFQFAFGVANVCSITLAIPAGQSRLFCSRPVNDPLAPCSISCPGAGLIFNTGHAFVSSTNNAACARIAVDAQQFFTRDAADDLVESQSKLSVVKIGLGNIGD